MKLHPLDDRIVVRPASPRRHGVGLVILTRPRRSPSRRNPRRGPGRRAENSGDIIPLDVAVATPSSIRSTRHRDHRRRGGPPDLSGRDVLAKLDK